VEKEKYGQFTIGDRALKIEPMRERGGFVTVDPEWSVAASAAAGRGHREVSVDCHGDEVDRVALAGGTPSPEDGVVHGLPVPGQHRG
jgi:hypothetical protein